MTDDVPTIDPRLQAATRLYTIRAVAGVLADITREAIDQHYPLPSPFTDEDVAMLEAVEAAATTARIAASTAAARVTSEYVKGAMA